MLRYPEEAVKPIWPHIQMARGCCKSIILPYVWGWASHSVPVCNLIEVRKLEVAKSSYHPSTISVSQKLVLFNLFIIILGSGTEYILAHWQIIANWREEVLRWREGLLPRYTLELWRTKLMWTSWSLLKRSKCHVFGLGWNNPKQQYSVPTN